MAEPTTTTQQAKSGGVPNQAALYSKVAAKENDILGALFEMLASRNENIRLGAAKALINKILPDLKSTELTGANGEPIKFNIIAGGDYVSALGKLTSTSNQSFTYRPSEVQSADLAPESAQDDNSNKSVSEVEST